MSLYRVLLMRNLRTPPKRFCLLFKCLLYRVCYKDRYSLWTFIFLYLFNPIRCRKATFLHSTTQLHCVMRFEPSSGECCPDKRYSLPSDQLLCLCCSVRMVVVSPCKKLFKDSIKKVRELFFWQIQDPLSPPPLVTLPIWKKYGFM